MMTVAGARSRQVAIHLVGGARPNFMKVAPLYHAQKAEDWCDLTIVHTGQHYDPNMSDVFFSDLCLLPDHHLDVGSGTHAEQTAKVMLAYESLCQRNGHDLSRLRSDFGDKDTQEQGSSKDTPAKSAAPD